MKTKPINSPMAPPPIGSYSQALEVKNIRRFLFVSGQTPESLHTELPKDFESQAKQTWSSIMAQLEEANMNASNLVKVTTYLSSRNHLKENREVREIFLGNHKPALTVVIAELFDEDWHLEIEAIAAE